MLIFIIKRLFTIVPTLFVIATVTFFLMRLAPGGPFTREKITSPEIIENINKKYHFDEPLYKQYLRYLWDSLHGDLGPSFKYPNRTVNEIIIDSFPISLELGLLAMLIALTFGLFSGLIASLKQNKFFDYLMMSISMLGISVPNFVLGPLLVLIFALQFSWLPVAGWEGWEYKILPSITLSAIYVAYISRLTRGGMIEILGQDYIKVARAKGLPERLIITRHAIKGGLMPVVSFLGPALSWIFTGSLVVETIFNVPGLGRFFVQSALNRDYTVVMGVTLFYAVILMVLNIFVDIIYAFLDPRIRYE